jgi:hypothetical protein
MNIVRVSLVLLLLLITGMIPAHPEEQMRPEHPDGMPLRTRMAIDHHTRIDFTNVLWMLNNSHNRNPTADQRCREGTETVNRYPIILEGRGYADIFGGRVHGSVPQNSLWGPSYCNSAAIMIDTAGASLRNFHASDVWDGIRILGPEGARFTLANIWIDGARDDCIENDTLRSLTVRNALLESCFMGISLQPQCADSASACNYDGAGSTVILDSSLLKLKDTTAVTDSDEKVLGGVFFKSSNWSPKLVIRNSVLALEDILPRDRSRLKSFVNKLSTCENNTLLLFGTDPIPEFDFPESCFVVYRGAEARQKWATLREQWILQNGHRFAP